MTRVCRRPEALLDGAPKASRLVEPCSDAERYFNRGVVAGKVKGFAGHLAMLGDRDLPRAPGPTRLVTIEGQSMLAIRGEDVTPEGGPAMYGFGFAEGGVFIGVSRIVGEQSQRLGWINYVGEGEPDFRSPDNPEAAIENAAKISELTQLFAAGVDAAEWALD